MSDWNIRNFLKREFVSFVRSGWLPPSWTGPLSVPTLTSSWNVIPIGSCVYIYSFNGVVLWLAINSRNTCHPWLFKQCWYVLLDWRQYHRRKITHQMLSLIPHLPVCTINYGDCSAFILFYKKTRYIFVDLVNDIMWFLLAGYLMFAMDATTRPSDSLPTKMLAHLTRASCLIFYLSSGSWYV